MSKMTSIRPKMASFGFLPGRKMTASWDEFRKELSFGLQQEKPLFHKQSRDFSSNYIILLIKKHGIDIIHRNQNADHDHHGKEQEGSQSECVVQNGGCH